MRGLDLGDDLRIDGQALDLPRHAVEEGLVLGGQTRHPFLPQLARGGPGSSHGAARDDRRRPPPSPARPARSAPRVARLSFAPQASPIREGPALRRGRRVGASALEEQGGGQGQRGEGSQGEHEDGRGARRSHGPPAAARPSNRGQYGSAGSHTATSRMTTTSAAITGSRPKRGRASPAPWRAPVPDVRRPGRGRARAPGGSAAATRPPRPRGPPAARTERLGNRGTRRQLSRWARAAARVWASPSPKWRASAALRLTALRHGRKLPEAPSCARSSATARWKRAFSVPSGVPVSRAISWNLSWW